MPAALSICWAMARPDPAPPPRVAFQGEPGAFSELAIAAAWPSGAVGAPCRTFDELAAAVLEGRADYGVVPVENAIAGPVPAARAALDAAGDRLRHHHDVRVPVHLCLMAPRGATLDGLRIVRSHPVALLQCRIFLARHPWFEARPHDDTAGAAREVAEQGDPTVGAIAGAPAAARYGLDLLAERIEDVPHNWTRFLIVSRNHDHDTSAR
jgi:prephenate dehydratase